MTHTDIVEIVSQIQCGRIKWRVEPLSSGNLLQPVFVIDGKQWTGRKWYISSHAVKSEVVSTAFKAALTVAEHELRESFLYKGRAIFGPHFNVEALHELANDRNLEVRDEPK